MKNRAVVSLLLIGLLATALFLCPAYAKTGLKFSPQDIRTFTLNNGLNVILKEDHRTPTFAAALYIRTGSATEGEYAGSGITHLIEHLIFKGTPSRSGLQLEAQIKSLGGDMGAYTTLDHTTFKIDGSSDGLLPLLDIFYDIISNPLFDAQEFEKERGVIVREIKMGDDDPSRYLSEQFWQTAFLIHPYKNPVAGFEAMLSQLTAEDVKKYYSKFYVPDNMVLVIVGDINPALVKHRLESTFGSLKRRSFSPAAVQQEPKQLAPRYRELAYPVSKTYMMMGFHSVGMSDSDIYALDTLSMLLGQGNSSILYQSLHNRLKIVYDISAYNYTPFDPGVFLIGCAFEPAQKDKVISQVLQEIDSIKSAPLKEEQLDKAKNQAISSYIFSKQTQESQAAELGVSQLLTGSPDFALHYVQGINAVSASDVMNAACRYLTRENMTTVLMVPSAAAPDTADVGTPAAVRRTVIKKTLNNGITLLVTEDSSLPLVSIRAAMIGGLRSETKDTNGISNIAARMLAKGTQSKSEDDIFTLVESLGGSLSTYSANNSLGINIDLLSKDVKRGLDLLDELMTKPIFPAEKLQALKTDVLAQIMLADDDIFTVTQKRMRKALFKDHPYGMMPLGEKESVERIDRDDVVAFYKNHLTGPGIIISVCGDVSADDLFAFCSSKFKSVSRERGYRTRKAHLERIDQRLEIMAEMPKEQAVVMAGFRSAGLDNPDRYPLQILSSMFSGGAGRLYANIRQKKGMSYTLGTFGFTGIDTGSFVFYAACQPDNVNTVKDEIFQQIKKVAQGEVSQDEIDAAKKVLVMEHLQGLQSAGDFALKTALDEIYGLGFGNYLTYPDIINNISMQDVVKAAQKYLTTESCVVSITLPEK